MKTYTIVVNMVWQLPDQECRQCMEVVRSHDKYLAIYNEYFKKEGFDVVQIPYSLDTIEIREQIQEFLNI